LLPRDEDDLRGMIGVNEAAEESDLIIVGLQEVGESLSQIIKADRLRSSQSEFDYVCQQ
jgi:hypothetical protein